MNDPCFRTRPGYVMILVTALLLAVPSAVAVFSQTGAGSGAGRAAAGDGAPGTGPVTQAKADERSHTITVAGRLEPQTRIEHRIPSGGYVTTIAVRAGDPVQRGAELLRVRRRDDVLELYQPVPLNARITGRVAAVHVAEESEVTAGDTAVTILGADGFLLRAHVTDKDAFRVAIGSAVVGTTTDGTTVSGVLRDRSQEPDYETGLFELTFRFPAVADVRLGEFVRIDLPIDRTDGVFVPRDAVVRRYGSFFLWVVDGDDRLVAREVAMGPAFDDEVQITAGLDPGERYLQTLTGREREGDTVDAAR